ncbi:NADP-dependent 3-hydroxy acid dehydrogenase YdfG [Rhodovulum imhoffii]|uniref:NADP-dependent 3-hydroxy acid dehydrogenase YdfG n=1 Tax=Rhodovulum imhoffii TaxID=365340 RepID=A0A2T5BUV5_9RHOB|nr:SDR family oxidoreductase [Rhodovulum imhoffii]MBK5934908.1 short-chain dehydrogenase [Rhodovulum imhoffii]PTN03309.1 NADP-dependent 3-hydroxy acid dehydrogenase YdfG [Rhodovulum imhoffii]
MARLTGKTVLITGASRGIGAAAAREFVQAGARVALVARSGAAIATLAREIGESALALPCDVADFTALSQVVTEVRTRFGGLDILVNNAGVIDPIGPLAQADPAAWGALIDINLKGVFNGMRAVLPGMISAGGGTILTVSSGAAHNALDGWSAYCASKAGVAMLTRSADRENRARGIRALGLSPGTVATDMQRRIRESGVNRISRLDWAEHIPPAWPARALVWMSGPEADEFLGQEVSLREQAIRRRVGLA